VISHLLKPAQGERAADSGEKLRVNVELKRPVIQPRPFLSDGDLKQTTDFIARTADAISEMARRNEAIEAHARKLIERHKQDADAARLRAAELEANVSALQARMDEMAADFQGRVAELQDKLTSSRADLELKTKDAELARQWLVYLSTEITQRLGDAPLKLEELAAETRAGLGVDKR
jgi:DNA repair exonuclease SbcCD ATPase subunit